MCNNKHPTLDNRLINERELFFNSSFKKIAKLINKDRTTISKEIRNHIMYKNSDVVGMEKPSLIVSIVMIVRIKLSIDKT